MEPFNVSLEPFLIFIVVLTRISGLVSFAPFWSHRAVNLRVRALLALILALMLTPVLKSRINLPPTDLSGLSLVIAGELLTGCLLGYVSRVIFSALDLAAHILGFQMGLSLAATIDPATRAQTAALGTITQMSGLMVFLGTDGHHWMLQAVFRSYAFHSGGAFSLHPSMTELVIRVSAESMAIGTALAASAIIVLVAMEFILAVAGRAAPQLQVMLLSFPLKIAVGLWLTGASLYFLPGAMRTIFSQMQGAISRLLSGE
jgi:flagellar biosynthetic protein FliR